MIKPIVIYKADRVVCPSCHHTLMLDKESEHTICSDDTFKITIPTGFPNFCIRCGVEYSLTLEEDIVKGVA